jgi:hypothetical protein
MSYVSPDNNVLECGAPAGDADPHARLCMVLGERLHAPAQPLAQRSTGAKNSQRESKFKDLFNLKSR